MASTAVGLVDNTRETLMRAALQNAAVNANKELAPALQAVSLNQGWSGGILNLAATAQKAAQYSLACLTGNWVSHWIQELMNSYGKRRTVWPEAWPNEVWPWPCSKIPKAGGIHPYATSADIPAMHLLFIAADGRVTCWFPGM
jgi:hypothetical protein